MSNEAWDAIWADIGVVITPAPAPLVKAATLYDRDGHLGTEARQLCAMFRVPPDFDETVMRRALDLFLYGEPDN